MIRALFVVLAFLASAASASAQSRDAVVRVLAVGAPRERELPGLAGRSRTVGVPTVRLGSGFVTGDGRIVTAAHVVEGALLLAVEVGGRALRAEVAAQDAGIDVAVLVTVEPLPAALALGAAPAPGTTVSIAGFARSGAAVDAAATVTGRLPSGEVVLDAHVDTGASGAPVLDASGAVVGALLVRHDVELGGSTYAASPDRIAAVLVAADATAVAIRSGLADSADGPLVARLAGALTELAALERITEVAGDASLDGLEGSRDPDVLALVASRLDFLAISVLELRGGLAGPDDLPPGAEHDRVAALWRRARETAARAEALDASVLERAPFLRSLRRSTTVAAASDAVVEPDETAPLDDAAIPGAPSDVHDARLWLETGLGLHIANAYTVSAAGFDTAIGVHGSPYTVRSGVFAADALIGASFHVGYWGTGGYGFPLNLSLLGELGVVLRFGGHESFVVGAAWTPGLAIVYGQWLGVLGGWRAFVGLQTGSIVLRLGWHGLQPEQTVPQHLIELSISWLFF